MRSYEFLDVLIARARRSPKAANGDRYVIIADDEIEHLDRAAGELFSSDPVSWREVPMGVDEDAPHE